MNLHQLRIFESVSRHLNVTAASRELHMSQPAVSNCENRSGRGVNRGRAFFDPIRPIEAQV
jgi:Bacterial regulatory helix-turn-helix protein, lysR family